MPERKFWCFDFPTNQRPADRLEKPKIHPLRTDSGRQAKRCEDCGCQQKTEPGWSCIRVRGSLDFELTGIIANLSGTLADVGISIFAISTFETDYVLVKSADMDKARDALVDNGYVIHAAQE